MPSKACIARIRGSRSFHQSAASDRIAFTAIEKRILDASLKHVPENGFTQSAISRGLQQLGYPEVSSNVFARGPFDLVMYQLHTQRKALEQASLPEGENTVLQNVRAYTLNRLRCNIPIIHQWQGAMALLAQPNNLPISMSELWQLSDSIWHLADDKSTDESWYSKRVALMGIYSSSELFMTTDTSKDYAETASFLQRMIDRMDSVGKPLSAVAEWTCFSAKSLINMARSKGMWI